MGLSASSESGHSSIRASSEENNRPDRKLQAVKMAYSWDNRVKFVVRFMYEIDNNGFLDKNDFECLAVRNTIIESKGKWDDAKFAKNKDGEVSVEEFKKGISASCKDKAYKDFPTAFKFFIDSSFRTIDIDGDGAVGLEEFRFDCVNRNAYRTVDELNQAYEKLLTEDDKKKGGITLERYQELYAQFIGNPDESCSACYLFGPLTVLD